MEQKLKVKAKEKRKREKTGKEESTNDVELEDNCASKKQKKVSAPLHTFQYMLVLVD
jgi:hypothetical protein